MDIRVAFILGGVIVAALFSAFNEAVDERGDPTPASYLLLLLLALLAWVGSSWLLLYLTGMA